MLQCKTNVVFSFADSPEDTEMGVTGNNIPVPMIEDSGSNVSEKVFTENGSIILSDSYYIVKYMAHADWSLLNL